MNHRRARLIAFVGTLAAATLNWGCTEGALAPTAHRNTPQGVASYVSSATGTTVTIVDDSGHSFVLDAVSHTLTVDGITSEPLTADQELKLASVLAGTVNSDVLSDAVCASGPGGGGISASLNIDDSRSNASRPSRRDLRVRKARGPRRAIPGTRNDVVPVSNGWMASTDWSCLDIANAVYAATLRYRAIRSATLHALADAVKDLVEVDPATGEVRFKWPNPASLGPNMDQIAFDFAEARTELNVLATVYRAQGCWQGSWPGVNGSGFGGGSRYTLSCYSESGWEISVDGGNTWAALDAPVTVCEFVPA